MNFKVCKATQINFGLSPIEAAIATQALSEGVKCVGPRVLLLPLGSARRLVKKLLELAPDPGLALSLARYYTSQGEDWNSYCKDMQTNYPLQSKCQEVWTGDHIAYRCRTCGLSDSSCMCVNCFNAGDHVGHDYRVYRCSSGGCCDCGDSMAWSPSGFCNRHACQTAERLRFPSENAERFRSSVASILEVFIASIPSISKNETTQNTTTHSPEAISPEETARIRNLIAACCSWLTEASDICTPFRDIICEEMLVEDTLTPLPANRQPAVSEKGTSTTDCQLYVSRYKPLSMFCPLVPQSSNRREETSSLEVTSLDETSCLPSWSACSNTRLDHLLSCGILLPENLCDQVGVLFLKLLFSSPFKEKYTTRFIRHYPTLINTYVECSSQTTMKSITRFLDRIFCQLFHNPQQVLTLVQNNDLITLLVSKLLGLIRSAVSKFVLMPHFGVSIASQPPPQRQQIVVPMLDCGNRVIQEHLYSRLAADLRTLLEHDIVSSVTLWSSVTSIHMRPPSSLQTEEWSAQQSAGVGHGTLLGIVLQLLRLAQNMDLQEKASGGHVEYESKTWQAAFILDHELMLLLNTLIVGFRHLLYSTTRDEESVESQLGMLEHTQSKIVLQIAHETKKLGFLATSRLILRPVESSLLQWVCSPAGMLLKVHEHIFSNQNLPAYETPLSFHIPLHRFYGCLVNEVFRLAPPGITLQEVFDPKDLANGFAVYLVEHPLRVHLLKSQIACGMWAKNGVVMQHQVSYYLSKYWHDTGLDIDMMLLQIGAILLGGDQFLKLVCERFQIKSLSQSRKPCDPTLKRLGHVFDLAEETHHAMIVEMLKLLLQLATERSRLNLTQSQKVRRELIQWLSTGPMTASQLSGKVAFGLADLPEFDDILREVGEFHLPAESEMNNGFFKLRSERWMDVDPFFAHFTRMDQQRMEENYRQFCKSAQGQEFWRVRQKELSFPYCPRIVPLKSLQPTCPMFESLPYHILYTARLHALAFIILYNAAHAIAGPEDVTGPRFAGHKTPAKSGVEEEAINMALYALALCVQLPRQACWNCDGSKNNIKETMEKDVLGLDAITYFMPSGDPFTNALFVVPGCVLPPQHAAPSDTHHRKPEDEVGASLILLLIWLHDQEQVADQQPFVRYILSRLEAQDPRCAEVIHTMNVSSAFHDICNTRKRERESEGGLDLVSVRMSSSITGLNFGGSDGNKMDTDRYRRLREAKERQQAILDRMKKQQQAAAKNLFEVSALKKSSDMVEDQPDEAVQYRQDSVGHRAFKQIENHVTDLSPRARSRNGSEDSYRGLSGARDDEPCVECALCKSKSSVENSGDSAFGMVSFLTATTILSTIAAQSWTADHMTPYPKQIFDMDDCCHSVDHQAINESYLVIESEKRDNFIDSLSAMNSKTFTSRNPTTTHPSSGMEQLLQRERRSKSLRQNALFYYKTSRDYLQTRHVLDQSRDCGEYFTDSLRDSSNELKGSGDKEKMSVTPIFENGTDPGSVNPASKNQAHRRSYGNQSHKECSDGRLVKDVSIHVQSCGHKMHIDCFDSYFASLVERKTQWQGIDGERAVDLSAGEFLCPVCRRLGNCLMPIVTSQLFDTSATPTSSFRDSESEVTNGFIQQTNLPKTSSRENDLEKHSTSFTFGSRIRWFDEWLQCSLINHTGTNTSAGGDMTTSAAHEPRVPPVGNKRQAVNPSTAYLFPCETFHDTLSHKMASAATQMVCALKDASRLVASAENNAFTSLNTFSSTPEPALTFSNHLVSGTKSGIFVYTGVCKILHDNICTTEVGLRSQWPASSKISSSFSAPKLKSTHGEQIAQIVQRHISSSMPEVLSSIHKLKLFIHSMIDREIISRPLNKNLSPSQELDESTVSVKHHAATWKRWISNRLSIVFGHQTLLDESDGLPLLSQDLFEVFMLMVNNPRDCDISNPIYNDIVSKPHSSSASPPGSHKDQFSSDKCAVLQAMRVCRLIFPAVLMQACILVALSANRQTCSRQKEYQEYIGKCGSGKSEWQVPCVETPRSHVDRHQGKCQSWEEAETLYDIHACAFALVSRAGLDRLSPIPWLLFENLPYHDGHHISSDHISSAPIPKNNSTLNERMWFHELMTKICLTFLRRVGIYMAACLGVSSCSDFLNDISCPALEDVSQHENCIDDPHWLCAYLGLPSIGDTFKRNCMGKSQRSLLAAWSAQFESSIANFKTVSSRLSVFTSKQVSSHVANPFQLISVIPPSFSFKPLALIALPQLYTQVFLDYCQSSVCYICGLVPEHPALCLVCETLVCCHSPICRLGGLGGCTSHANLCGAGYASFLLVRACTVLMLMSGGRRCVWGSLYLDSNGEEDRNMKRGKTLFLHKGRYEQLRQTMAAHRYSQDTRILSHSSRRDGDLF